jgi:sugar O-acyltransferase (sialic acid O-acetyltransferase NeuD family)
MKKALIGYGGHAREVMAQMETKLPCFVDDNYVCKKTLPISSLDITKYKVMVAIANPIERNNMVKKLPKGVKFFSFIHPSAIILDKNIKIGKGSFIGANTILTTNISIGDHCILNRSNHVGHDTVVGDYVSMMPGSIISGNCLIGNNVYVGTNSSVREKITICDDVILGLNSGVIKNITESGVYGGTPCKKIK